MSDRILVSTKAKSPAKSRIRRRRLRNNFSPSPCADYAIANSIPTDHQLRHGIVLLLLCTYYSLATLQTPQLTGPAAVDEISRKVTGTKPNPLIILVASPSSEDQSFAQLLDQKLKIDRTATDPPSARTMIPELIAAGRTPDFIIATENTAKWLPNVLERIPQARNIPVINPRHLPLPHLPPKGQPPQHRQPDRRHRQSSPSA